MKEIVGLSSSDLWGQEGMLWYVRDSQCGEAGDVRYGEGLWNGRLRESRVEGTMHRGRPKGQGNIHMILTASISADGPACMHHRVRSKSTCSVLTSASPWTLLSSTTIVSLSLTTTTSFGTNGDCPTSGVGG